MKAALGAGWLRSAGFRVATDKIDGLKRVYFFVLGLGAGWMARSIVGWGTRRFSGMAAVAKG